jgi:hypothetical protein
VTVLTDLLLTDDEFALLTVDEQREYLTILQASLDLWVLTPKQVEFDALADACFACLIGGAAGPGKSEWALYRANRLSLEVPGHRTLILRRTFPELRRSMIQRSILRIKPEDAVYRIGDKEWHYKNGSIIEFGYLDSDENVGIYQSAEYDMVVFDEAAEFTPYMLDFLKSRTRTTVAKRRLGARPHVIYTSNPGGPGHGYLRREFILPCGKEGGVLVRADGRRIGFMPGFARDNPHLDVEDYTKTLEALPTIMRRRFLLGDWSAIEGQFFVEWEDERHVCDDFEIPDSWRRARGIDYGFTNPYACLWIAWDHDKRAFVYAERYERMFTPRQQARQILEVGPVNMSVADPAIFAQTGIGEPIATQYVRAGVWTTKANNARMSGWANVREYLADMPDRKPGLQVFRSCTDTIRTIPDLVHSKSDPEDVDTDGEDHLADALRYALATQPRRPRRDPTEPPKTDMQTRVHQHVRRVSRNHRRPNSIWKVSQ